MLTNEQYLDLFRFRGDSFALQQKDGSYVRIMRAPTKEDLENHFNYTATMALYPGMNQQCYIGCLDYDLPKSERNNKDAHREIQYKISAAYDMLHDIGVKSTLIEATGGRGYHLWVFSDLVPTSMMVSLLERICEASLSDAEIFPLDSHGLGKAIRPPLGMHQVYGGQSKFVDPTHFERITISEEYYNFLNENRVTKEFLQSLGIKENKIDKESFDSDFSYSTIPKAGNFKDVLEEMRPCFQQIYYNATETSGGQGWSFMTAAAAEVYANGGTDDDVHEYFRVQAQYNPKETRKNLKPIKRKNLMPFRCSKLQQVCSDYVSEFCPDCHIYKQHTLSEKIDEVVDKTQGKEDRNDGGIEDTLEQFSHVAIDLNDLMSGDEYTMITNSFDSGKSWTTIGFLKHAIHKEGHRINFITPTKKVKEVMMERMKKAEINFLDNPSNIDLCSRAASFRKLGYVPTMVCKKCSMYTPIQKLIKPITEDYIENADKPFYGDIEYYTEKADEYDTCPKWIYLATLEATREENMALLMTSAKLMHHFFIPDSPLIPAMSSSQTYCNIIDQIDFVNRNIPKITFSDKVVFEKMRKLGLLVIDDLEEAKVRIGDMLENDDIEAQTLEELEAVDYLNNWLYSQKAYDEGKYRRISNVNNPSLYHFDHAGERELKFVLNDVVGKKINPRLYDSLLNYIKNIEIHTYDENIVVPKSFKEVLEDFTQCNAILGITSTPSELEVMNSQWLSRYHETQDNMLKNLYSIPNAPDVMPDFGIDERTIIFSRKNDGMEFINNGLVRGNTGTGGKADDVIVRSMQYPKNSEIVMADMIQLCGGDFGKGIKTFYQSIASDAITQAHKFDAERIIVPKPDVFNALGFDVKIHHDFTLEYWKEKLTELFENKDYVYRNRLYRISDEVLDILLNEGFLKMDGKKICLA